jgi:hypothetical protein
MKTMNDKQFPVDALRFWKLVPNNDKTGMGWEIFIGNAHSENMCDPLTHYIFNDVIEMFKHLRGYIDHEDRHIGELLNEVIRYDLRNSELCVTDASFSEQIGIGVAISFKMNFNTVENYSVIFSFFK